MIYDCFMFYNELDLLEIRMNILDKFVDRFVLVESTKTFTGNAKPLHFNENKNRFSAFNKKIIHIIVNDDPDQCESAWDRETFQRNCIIRGLINCNPSDTILLSDLDEIPNPEILKHKPRIPKPIRFQQLLFYYFFNNINTTEPWWSGTHMVKYKHLKKWTPQEIRKLQRKYCHIQGNGGWHFSYLGDSHFISEKIRDFSHQEFNNPTYNSRENIQKSIEGEQDLFGRDYEFEVVQFDNSFPEFLLKNKNQYARFIKNPLQNSRSITTIIPRRSKPNLLEKLQHKWVKHNKKKQS